MINNIYIEKFKNWLLNKGAEILPVTNQYEAIRFKGKEIGVLYKSGKVNNSYTRNAVSCYEKNKKWDGRPIKTGRYDSYRKQKLQLIKRDGTDCFYCGQLLEDDISLEHLLSLTSGGKNSLGNLVLCHKKCNHEVENITIVEKVKIAISKRLKNGK